MAVAIRQRSAVGMSPSLRAGFELQVVEVGIERSLYIVVGNLAVADKNMLNSEIPDTG